MKPVMILESQIIHPEQVNAVFHKFTLTQALFPGSSFYLICKSAPLKAQEIPETCAIFPECYITPSSSGKFGVGLNRRRCKTAETNAKPPASKVIVFSKEKKPQL